MKAKDIAKYFSELEPDSDICALWFERPGYATEDGEKEPTKETWAVVCEQFDNSRSVDYVIEYVSEWVAEKVAEIEREEEEE
jgi:hypothetical protein